MHPYLSSSRRRGPAGRARAEGLGARASLLFSAAFSAFAVIFALHAAGRVSILALSPAVLVALVLALGAVHRSALLRLAGVSVGVLYVLAGLADAGPLTARALAHGRLVAAVPTPTPPPSPAPPSAGPP